MGAGRRTGCGMSVHPTWPNLQVFTEHRERHDDAQTTAPTWAASVATELKMTDHAAEAAALLRRDAEFAAAAGEGRDIEAVVSYWSADAVVTPPGQAPIIGRDALREYVQASYQIPGFNITWEATAEPEFSSDLSMAYMWARNQVSFDDPDGTRVTVHGRALTIWRREADGEWRCAVDIWNEESQS